MEYFKHFSIPVPGFIELVNNRFRSTSDEGIFQDVCDGLAYKQNLLLKHPNTLSLTMNTDGVALFRSSTKSLWPIWLVINELPVAERYI